MSISPIADGVTVGGRVAGGPGVDDRDHSPGEAALVVAAYQRLSDPAHDHGIALRIDPFGAHLRVEVLHEVGTRVSTRQRHE